MTQQSTNKTYHTFVKGIITEAGPLTFPENASLDEENCVLMADGGRQRRLGMDFELNHQLRAITLGDDEVVASFQWKNAANDTNSQFAVVQAGSRIMVFDASAQIISANMLADFDASAYITGTTVITGAEGLGYFFIDTGTSLPLYLSYDPSGPSFALTEYTIMIRDIFGVDDSLAVDTTPPTLSNNHHYNLLNQGWTTALANAYDAATTNFPSNAMQWFVGKDSNEDFQPTLLSKQHFGTTPAPKGRYVIGAFDRSGYRNALSGVTTPTDQEGGRPSVVAFGFERLFHSGVQSNVIATASETRPNMTGFVFYSRTLRSLKDINQYHTDADPTSEIDSELVDTDGGFVNIPNSGMIHKMMQLGNSMVVFAEHGVWALEGDEGGFRATATKVSKISKFGTVSGASVVDVEDGIIYWNKSGIFLLAINPDNGQLTSRNITEDTIKTLYNSINLVAKKHAVGTFDSVNRRVMWMYSGDPTYTGLVFKQRYDRELVLDLPLGAFYKHKISSYEDFASPHIAGYLQLPDFVLEDGFRSRGATTLKYLTVRYTDPTVSSAHFTFSHYRRPELRDWRVTDGEGLRYSSYLISGYEIMNDSAREKQARYLVTHFKFTETEAVFDGGELVPSNPSGCLVQAQWEWSNHPNYGKWGPEAQAYRLLKPLTITAFGDIDAGLTVVTNKHRLNGSGKSLSLFFQSDEDKDFYLYGWNVSFTGNSNV